MGILKTIFKATLWLLLLIVLCLGFAATYVWLNEDKLVALLVNQANKHLKAEVKVGRISASLWQNFPAVSITLYDVMIPSSDANSDVSNSITGSVKQNSNQKSNLLSSPDTLLVMQRLSFAFDVLALYKGNYTIRELKASKGKIKIRHQLNGVGNYDIFKPDTTATPTNAKPLTFDLKKCLLDSVNVIYQNLQTQQLYNIYLYNAKANLHYAVAGEITFGIKAGGLIKKLAIGNQKYLTQKPFNLTTEVTLNTKAKALVLATTNLNLNQALFNLKGNLNYGQSKSINLSIDSPQVDLANLLSLLPDGIAKAFRQYKTEGRVYFAGFVAGLIGGNNTPKVEANFGADKAAFYHPDYKIKLDNLSFKGSFSNGAQHATKTSSLIIDNLSATLDNKPITASLSYVDFDNPTLTLKTQLNATLQAINNFFPINGLVNPTGNVDASINFRGKLADVKANRLSALTLDAELSLTDAAMQIKGTSIDVKYLEGTFLVDTKRIAINQLKAKLDQSDIAITGTIGNPLALIANTIGNTLTLNKPKVLIDLDLESNYLNLNQLQEAWTNKTEKRAAQTIAASASSASASTSSSAVAYHIACNIGQLRYQQFMPKTVKANIYWQGTQTQLSDFSCHIANGRLSANGTLDTRNPTNLKLKGHLNTERVEVDSIFNTFANFGQKYLTDANIKGYLTSSTDADMALDQSFQIIPASVKAQTVFTLINAELIDIEAFNAMGKYLKNKDFTHLHFGMLKNTITINNSEIIIADMAVNTSAVSFNISGTHSFSQTVNYRVRFPLKNFLKEDKDQRFGTIAADNEGQGTALLLKITGKEGAMQVSLDKDQTKASIKETLKKEKAAFLDIFNAKEKTVAPTKDADNTKPIKTPAKPLPPPAEPEFLDLD